MREQLQHVALVVDVERVPSLGTSGLFSSHASPPAAGASTVNHAVRGSLTSSPRAAIATTSCSPFHDSPNTTISPVNSVPPSSTGISATGSPPSTVMVTISAPSSSSLTSTVTVPADFKRVGFSVMSAITGGGRSAASVASVLDSPLALLAALPVGSSQVVKVLGAPVPEASLSPSPPSVSSRHPPNAHFPHGLRW
jgi:hypothetical protein